MFCIIGERPMVSPRASLDVCAAWIYPIGASGVAQMYELVTQLRGEAGERQVKDAKIALAHNGGGNLGPGGAALCIHILGNK